MRDVTISYYHNSLLSHYRCPSCIFAAMKAKHTVLLIAIGYALDFWASLRRITHSADANTLLFIATVCKVAGVLLLAYKVIRYKGFKNFMES